MSVGRSAARHGARDRGVLSSRGVTAHDQGHQSRPAFSAALGGKPRVIDRNVAQLVQIPKQRRRRPVPWTSEEARCFLESARSSSDPLYAAYVLVLVLGLRKGRFSAFPGRPSISRRAHLCPTISSNEAGDPFSTGKRKPRRPMPGCRCRTSWPRR